MVSVNSHVIDRFYSKTKRNEATGCLEWTAGGTPDGYGTFYDGGGSWRAHRWIYTLLVGPIPEGLLVRHLCDNPSCVEVTHLELGTHADNSQDMVDRGRYRLGRRVNSEKTRCPRGHEYTEENTSFRTGPDGSVKRRCRTCHRDRQAAYRKKVKHEQ